MADPRDVLESRDESRRRLPAWLGRLAPDRHPRAWAAVGGAAAVVTVALTGGGPGLLAGHRSPATPARTPAAVPSDRLSVGDVPASTLLTAAMLEPGDIDAGARSGRAAVVRDVTAFRPLHRCDRDPGPAVAGQRTVTGRHGVVVSQRILVAAGRERRHPRTPTRSPPCAAVLALQGRSRSRAGRWATPARSCRCSPVAPVPTWPCSGSGPS